MCQKNERVTPISNLGRLIARKYSSRTLPPPTPISNLGLPTMRGTSSRISWPFLWPNRANRPKKCQKKDHITPISNLGRQIMRGTSSRISWPFLQPKCAKRPKMCQKNGPRDANAHAHTLARPFFFKKNIYAYFYKYIYLFIFKNHN